MPVIILLHIMIIHIISIHNKNQLSCMKKEIANFATYPLTFEIHSEQQTKRGCCITRLRFCNIPSYQFVILHRNTESSMLPISWGILRQHTVWIRLNSDTSSQCQQYPRQYRKHYFLHKTNKALISRTWNTSVASKTAVVTIIRIEKRFLFIINPLFKYNLQNLFLLVTMPTGKTFSCSSTALGSIVWTEELIGFIENCAGKSWKNIYI